MVLTIAIDRIAGRLPAGQPLTVTCIHDIARRASRADASPIDGIQNMIDVLTGRGQVDRLEIKN